MTGFWCGGPSPLDPSSDFLTRYNPVPVATETIPALFTLPNANSTVIL